MKLYQLKQILKTVPQLNFVLEDGRLVPQHFHITEAGLVTKLFVDCGGTIRTHKSICFQIWTADDFEHRLEPQKFLQIISVAQPLFNEGEDLEVLVEYQQETICCYGLDFDGSNFLLTALQTDCLAKDKCGIPPAKKKINLSELQDSKTNNCTPGSGCC